ncbi:RNA polymerase sigma factor [Aquimarina sp. RZ0]|uniref:RNA polymerase sigma factor n=1 Tax=Aquimarina sp. RZ0 TaxID=2607730 RepID=UPI0011F1FF21|nr:sigma-70 family RNA polymerase sigma factor [Aquimarina sp. RZ0]KAA1242490.1 sigma-70 family RNA polymerase sigma factor [Aquimarina sp. RZ0]
MSSNTEEHKIIEGIVAGDESVLKIFYKKNYAYIRGYILQNSGDEADAEDVFQDALVLIYQKLSAGSLEFNSSLRTYFYGVCKNMWRNRLRKKKKLVIDDVIVQDSEEVDVSALEEIEHKEKEQLYRKYFLKLSDACKELLELVFSGRNMKEISDITGYSEGYARKKKFDCKRMLIEMIENDPIYRELNVTSEKK